ncbi:MAG: hypothetical protein R3237_06065 [Nitrosopumilaceae archaeon]|nr:hypothetical protein [Nitrosopumilaceae archaeon]
MPDESCRRCGHYLQVIENCSDCNSPIFFVCPQCHREPDKWIHSLCTNPKMQRMVIAA